MTKQELFKKYNINESHSAWDGRIDNWTSVEVYRIMHGGALPTNQNDLSVKYIAEFLDKVKDDKDFVEQLRQRHQQDFGNLFLTAKRMIHRFSDELIKELK